MQNKSVDYSPLINNKIYNNPSFYPFKRTQRMTRDYWWLWNECGLLNYCCKKIRKKYEIPNLDPDDDVREQFAFHEDQSFEIEHLIWYEAFGRRNELDDELDDLVKEFRLPFTARKKILLHILYKESLIKEPLVFNANLLPELVNMTKKVPLGYTPNELKVIKDYIETYWHSKFKKAHDLDYFTKKEKEETIEKLEKIIVEIIPPRLDSYLKMIKRSIRPLKNPQQKLLIIEQAKKYGTVEEEYDYDSGKMILRVQTSAVMAEKVYAQVDEDINFRSKAFRTELRRLKINYPLLKDFLDESR